MFYAICLVTVTPVWFCLCSRQTAGFVSNLFTFLQPLDPLELQHITQGRALQQQNKQDCCQCSAAITPWLGIDEWPRALMKALNYTIVNLSWVRLTSSIEEDTQCLQCLPLLARKVITQTQCHHICDVMFWLLHLSIDLYYICVLMHNKDMATVHNIKIQTVLSCFTIPLKPNNS